MARKPDSRAGEDEDGVVGSSTITRKFQVTIPKKARERFKLEEGDVVVFVEQGGSLYLINGNDLSLISPKSMKERERAVPYYLDYSGPK